MMKKMVEEVVEVAVPVVVDLAVAAVMLLVGISVVEVVKPDA